MNHFFIRFIALVQKELLVLFKNPKSRMAILVPPMLQLLVFGYAATLDLRHVKMAVLDHDQSQLSRELITAFTGSEIFRLTVLPANEAATADALNHYNALIALVIPPNFARKAQQGNAEVQLLVDARNSNTGGIALGYAQTVMEQFNRRRGAGVPVELSTRAWYNPNYDMRYFMIPALLAMLALLDTLMMAALTIAREREDGSFDQLLVAPYSPGEILAGKAIACILVGLLQLTLIFVLAQLWFQLPFYGSYWLLYLGFLVFVTSSVGTGLFLSSLCANLQQAMMGTFLVGVPFVLLSGLVTPIESMPAFFQYFTLVNPMRYGIKILQQLYLEGTGFGLLWPYYLLLSAIAVLNLGAAYWIFRRELRG